MLRLLFIQGSAFSLKAFVDFLGPVGNSLIYANKQEKYYVQRRAESKHCRPRSLPPIEEIFLTLLRLRLALLEQSLAYRFNIS